MKAEFLIAGDSAISIELDQEISLAVNAKIGALEQAVLARNIPGVTELIPSYRALMVCYDPCEIWGEDLIRICREITDSMEEDLGTGKTGRTFEIPVLYGGELGMDLHEVAEHEGMEEEELIRVHSSYPAHVYMFGFLPGMGYMGSKNGFTVPRKKSPRTRVEGGSVVVWKDQSIILPNTTPTGWQVIGHTPVVIFDLKKETPFLFQPGDEIRFVPVDEKTHAEIAEQVKAGTYRCRVFPSAE